MGIRTRFLHISGKFKKNLICLYSTKQIKFTYQGISQTDNFQNPEEWKIVDLVFHYKFRFTLMKERTLKFVTS